MLAAALVALALGAAPDPCAPVASAAPDAADPGAAAEYRAVGESERRAGNRDTAAAAFRDALARDPADATSRAALAALCAEAKAGSAFDRGVRLMDAGDRRGAVAAFEEARAGGDRSAALLEGICLYELGEEDRALPLLDEAGKDPDHAEAARFFQGLVALRRGRSDEAAALLQASAADRHLAPLALGLSRLARREGRLVLSVLAETGWDSNVDLTPDGAPGAARAGDGSAGLTALAHYAPMGDTGPFAQVTAHAREQLTYDALDIAGLGGAAGVQAGRGRQFLLAEYAYEYRELGGAPYLSANALLGEGRLAVGGGASAGLTWLARLESFRAADAPYSGLHQLGEADLTLEAGPRALVTLAWRLGLDGARDPALSWWETGPRAALHLAATPRLRLGLELAASQRTYRAVDLALGVVRSDRYLDAAALLEWDLAERWTLRLSATARKAFSNLPDFAYTKLAPTIGLAYTIGLF
ncbi:hypothetical protein [Anaeromyxobacter oryzisoli]|uniref:hypothetical protein n=1 Tax=Anaeromyxobacter oryzisoli TaxID=2925408 RepID=UPI001F56E898|nr:hypothetical protein [Anaeromyxobacter sp. SG63]